MNKKCNTASDLKRNENTRSQKAITPIGFSFLKWQINWWCNDSVNGKHSEKPRSTVFSFGSVNALLKHRMNPVVATYCGGLADHVT